MREKGSRFVSWRCGARENKRAAFVLSFFSLYTRVQAKRKVIWEELHEEGDGCV